MSRTSLLVVLLCLAAGVGAAYYWSRADAPAAIDPEPAATPQPAPLADSPAVPPPAPGTAAAPGAGGSAAAAVNPAAPSPSAPAPRGPPAKPLDPADPAAARDHQLRSGKGELFDPMNSGLRRN